MMAIKDLNGVVELLSEIAAELQTFDFDVPVEPRDDASADEWRDYGLDVADTLTRAEKLICQIKNQIEGG